MTTLIGIAFGLAAAALVAYWLLGRRLASLLRLDQQQLERHDLEALLRQRKRTALLAVALILVGVVMSMGHEAYLRRGERERMESPAILRLTAGGPETDRYLQLWSGEVDGRMRVHLTPGGFVALLVEGPREASLFVLAPEGQVAFFHHGGYGHELRLWLGPTAAGFAVDLWRGEALSSWLVATREGVWLEPEPAAGPLGGGRQLDLTEVSYSRSPRVATLARAGAFRLRGATSWRAVDGFTSRFHSRLMLELLLDE